MIWICVLGFLILWALYLLIPSQSISEWETCPFPEGCQGYVINLDHRKDRLEDLQGELQKLKWKVKRVSAVHMSPGWKGCVRSHIKALRQAQTDGCDWAIILEDDFQIHHIRPDLNRMLAGICASDYQVVCLSGNVLRSWPTSWRGIHRLHCGLAASCYMIRRDYIPTLIDLWERTKDDTQADMSWQRLQVRDRWGVLYPKLAIQRPGFSDIEQRHVDYSIYGT